MLCCETSLLSHWRIKTGSVLRACRRAKSSAPPFGGFGSPDNLRWIEKEIQVKPKLKVNCDDIWDFLYDTIRKGKPFPITTDEALEVMKVITAAKKGTRFA